MTEWEFVDSLPDTASRSGAPRWEDMPLGVALRERPGVWAKTFYSKQSVGKYRQAYGTRGFEFSVRNGVVYARFVGGDPQ